MDRQHPRDLFDVRDRTIAEVLAPARLDISQEFARGLDGMTQTPVTFDELLRAREELIEQLVVNMPQEHRQFLMKPTRKGASSLSAICYVSAARRI